MAAGPITSQDLAYAQDVLLNERYDREVQSFVNLLNILPPERQAAGTAIYQSTITGNLEEYTEGQDLPLSKYTETEGDPMIVQIKPYRKRTTAQSIQKSGYYMAVTRTDNEMIKDLRMATMESFFDAMDVQGAQSATGADFKKALINAGAKLNDTMEQHGDTASLPVYFVNRQDYAKWAGDNDVSNDGSGNVFGMTYIQNLAGATGIVFQTANVDSGTIFATDSDNIHLYTPDFAATAEGGLVYEVSDMGVIATHHAPSYEGASVETYVNGGLLVIPEVVDYIVKATIVPSA